MTRTLLWWVTTLGAVSAPEVAPSQSAAVDILVYPKCTHSSAPVVLHRSLMRASVGKTEYAVTAVHGPEYLRQLKVVTVFDLAGTEPDLRACLIEELRGAARRGLEEPGGSALIVPPAGSSSTYRRFRWGTEEAALEGGSIESHPACLPRLIEEISQSNPDVCTRMVTQSASVTAQTTRGRFCTSRLPHSACQSRIYTLPAVGCSIRYTSGRDHEKAVNPRTVFACFPYCGPLLWLTDTLCRAIRQHRDRQMATVKAHVPRPQSASWLRDVYE